MAHHSPRYTSDRSPYKNTTPVSQLASNRVDRQAVRQAGRQADRQAHHMQRETDKSTCKQIDRQTNRLASRSIDKQTSLKGEETRDVVSEGGAEEGTDGKEGD